MISVCKSLFPESYIQAEETVFLVDVDIFAEDVAADCEAAVGRDRVSVFHVLQNEFRMMTVIVCAETFFDSLSQRFGHFVCHQYDLSLFFEESLYLVLSVSS